MILALFIFGVTATSSGEGEPNTSVAPSSQTLDPAFSEGHSIPSGVIIEPIEAILDDRNAQEPFKAATPSSGSKMAYESPVLAPETTGEPDINDSVVSSNGDPVKTIEIDGDSCPDGYEELLDEEEPVLEEEKTAVAVEEADREATGTSVSGVEQAVEKNATNHSPVINDVPIDPLDRSFIETVQEVVAESNPSEVKETLEDFLAELFQESEGESSAASVQTPEGQKPKILTEEEIAEQKRRLEIETREKRIEITGRHAQWEQRLEERGKEVLAELLNQVKELRAYVSDDVENNEEISKLLSGYENEAAKAIKGVEAFFEKRIKIGKKVEESVVKTWEEVLRKVEKKVQDKKHEVDKEMQEYYNSYIDDELKYASTLSLDLFDPQSSCQPSYQIDAAAKRVESVADDAQADLGMDYAWLEDVTVSDWTRYHDLTRSMFEMFCCCPLC